MQLLHVDCELAPLEESSYSADLKRNCRKTIALSENPADCFKLSMLTTPGALFASRWCSVSGHWVKAGNISV